jgi:hypothetical protein
MMLHRIEGYSLQEIVLLTKSCGQDWAFSIQWVFFALGPCGSPAPTASLFTDLVTEIAPLAMEVWTFQGDDFSHGRKNGP